MMSLIPPVVFDNPKRGHGFGDVLVQPEDVSTNVINDTSSEVTVKATFVRKFYKIKKNGFFNNNKMSTDGCQ